METNPTELHTHTHVKPFFWYLIVIFPIQSFNNSPFICIILTCTQGAMWAQNRFLLYMSFHTCKRMIKKFMWAQATMQHMHTFTCMHAHSHKLTFTHTVWERKIICELTLIFRNQSTTTNPPKKKKLQGSLSNTFLVFFFYLWKKADFHLLQAKERRSRTTAVENWLWVGRKSPSQ